jgi:uncharacterized protein
MYEGSYNDFTQWAAAKYMPRGLKAMMTGAPAAPGIDVPMDGNVFWNFLYPWPIYTANGKGADEATYNRELRSLVRAKAVRASQVSSPTLRFLGQW